MSKRKDQQVAKRLTAALNETDPPLKKTHLAEKLGLSAGAVSHYLNGNRPCPEVVVRKIAKITGVEYGWLAHGVADAPKAPQRKKSTPALKWSFRPAPPDGGKDFGNASVYATPATIATVVREDAQNSLDAAQSPRTTIRFRLVELLPGTSTYERFVRALNLQELRDHIDAISTQAFDSKLGAKVTAGLEFISHERLVLLYVDDYGTHGLRGDEFDSNSPFAALVRDNLNSRKGSATAGGVFGLGSKVNLACSAISTVLFASKVASHPAQSRLIGRSELTYHEVGKQEFAGPGWFGITSDGGAIKSAWLADDSDILEALMLRRDILPAGVRSSTATGTSLLIVGFSDPENEADAGIQELADTFAEEAAVNLWPAILSDQLTVLVECYSGDAETPLKSIRVDPENTVGIREFCSAWTANASGSTAGALDAPGDVISVSIPMWIPGTRAGAKGIKQHPELQGEAQLIVKLGDADRVNDDPFANHVGYTRGRAMITRYQRKAHIGSGRPFHAVVLTGTLLGRSAEQVAIEQFLRMAEPPAHDKWTFNQDLGEKYQRGAKKALDDLAARIADELQRLLRPHAKSAVDGPEVIKRLLQFKLPKDSSSLRPIIRVLRTNAQIVDGAWHIESELSINPSPKETRIAPRLSFRCEGSPPIPVAWDSLQVSEDSEGIIDGTVIVAKPRTKRIIFSGKTDPKTHPAPAVQAIAQLDLNAKFGVES